MKRKRRRPEKYEDPATQMRMLISGYQVSQALYVAAALGLTDLLQEGPVSCASLAAATNTDEDSLFRLLCGLAGAGVFAETAPGVFKTTSLGDFLRRDAPDSLHARAMLLGQEWMWRPWGRLLDSISTGNDAFRSIFGMHFFEYLEVDQEASAVFQKAMSGGTSIRSKVIQRYDYSQVGTVADIGGGYGDLITDIVRTHAHIKGILFERPSVAEAVNRKFSSTNVEDRFQVVAGDFFKKVDVRADLYILSQIIHDWPDSAAITILSNCRQAMAANSRVLIIERSMEPSHGWHLRRLSDLNMMLLLGGRERSLRQYSNLLEVACLRLTKVIAEMDGWIAFEAAANVTLDNQVLAK